MQANAIESTHESYQQAEAKAEVKAEASLQTPESKGAKESKRARANVCEAA